MSFETNLKAEDDGKRRYSRKFIIVVTTYLLLDALAFYAFQSYSTLHQYQKTVLDATFPSDSSIQLTETFGEIRQLREELRKAQAQLIHVQEKHLKLLTDIQGNTKAIAAARTDVNRDTAAEAMRKAIEGDPYHRRMFDRRDRLPQDFRKYLAPQKLQFG